MDMSQVQTKASALQIVFPQPMTGQRSIQDQALVPYNHQQQHIQEKQTHLEPVGAKLILEWHNPLYSFATPAEGVKPFLGENDNTYNFDLVNHDYHCPLVQACWKNQKQKWQTVLFLYKMEVKQYPHVLLNWHTIRNMQNIEQCAEIDAIFTSFVYYIQWCRL